MVEDDESKGLLEIEVAYAKPEEQIVVKLSVPQGTTLIKAVQLSGLLTRFSEIDLSELKLGVFGIVCQLEQAVKQGDRVELYRALVNDPKDARRQRALNKR